VVELSDSLEKVDERWAPNFDFEGVNISTEINSAVPQEQVDAPRNFMITLRFSVLNETGKQCPYKIDLVAQGWFELAESIAQEKREELVRINGASLLLGAMRELVLQLTARSGFGPLLLPTLRFLPEASAPAQ
jgi:preprotein translocase subunit SecB